MKASILILISFFISITAKAQDIIVLINKKEIYCKVTEVGANEVKYVLSDSATVVYTVDISLVKEIRYADGKSERPDYRNLTIGEYFYHNRKKAIKFEFFSPVLSHSTFSFENCIKPGKSYEVGIGIIGLGWDNVDNSRGAFIKFGYKFIQNSNLRARYSQHEHIMRGGYSKPELTVGTYSRLKNRMFNKGKVKETLSYGAITINIGLQEVYNDVFLLDVYAGVGYIYIKSNLDFDPSVFFPADRELTTKHGVVSSPVIPVCFSGGFRIGFLLP